MTEDHTYCKDPDRSLRKLKRKFNVLSVEQDAMNNDIPCPGHDMQGEDKLDNIWPESSADQHNSVLSLINFITITIF